MNESQKTNMIRPKSFFEDYMSGAVIDIGCGIDPVLPNVERFDLADGDANSISRVRQASHYDCVYSSHCLEHMHDARAAIREWWTLVKNGGYLIVVVPHEDLYEQGYWPSLFNHDHKSTFRIGQSVSWSPVSVDVLELFSSLPGCKVVSCEIHDHHYDYCLQSHGRKHPKWLRRLGRHFMKRAISGSAPISKMSYGCLRAAHSLGAPVDQTIGRALAQIQIIGQKAHL